MKRVMLPLPQLLCVWLSSCGVRRPHPQGLHQDAVSGMQCGRRDLRSMEMARKPL